MPRIPTGKTHLSAREAATYTEKHINTIRRWIVDGTIKATRVGSRGHYVIAITELDDALKYDRDCQSQSTQIEMSV